MNLFKKQNSDRLPKKLNIEVTLLTENLLSIFRSISSLRRYLVKAKTL